MNILILTHRLPFPPDKGDRIRTWNLIRHLSKNHQVYLACLADEPVGQSEVATLRACAARVAVVPLGRTRWLKAARSLATGGSLSEGAFASREMSDLLKNWAAEIPFHAAIASSSAVAPYLQRGLLSGVPAVVDLVDVDSQKWFDYAAAARRAKAWLYRLEGRRTRKLEKEILAWSRAITLVSANEVELFHRVQERTDGPVYPVTNGVDLDYFRPVSVNRPESGCVFVGAMDYKPNVDAVCWFSEQVWPGIRANRPDATFKIVGRKPSPEVVALAKLPGVQVAGGVPDVRPFVAEAAVVVAPLRIARGLQNKVLEAMAMGKAVVASPAALNGFSAGEVPAWGVSTPADWVATVTRLLGDDAMRARMGADARRYAERRHSWSACLEPLDQLLATYAPGTPGRASSKPRPAAARS